MSKRNSEGKAIRPYFFPLSDFALNPIFLNASNRQDEGYSAPVHLQIPDSMRKAVNSVRSGSAL